MRRGDRGDAKSRRWNHEALVDKNLRADGMVNRHQRQIVVVVDLPQFRRDADIVEAIVRHELVAPDLVPLSRRRDLRRAERVDAQTDGGAPGHRILHKFHLLSVVGEKKRTGSFQALLGHDFLVSFHPKLGAHRAIGPDDSHHFRLCLLSQSEMKLRPGNRLFLHQQPGADFDFAANPERVDALIADRLDRVWPHNLPVIVLRALIYAPYRLPIGRETQKIEMAITTKVCSVKDQCRAGGTI